MTSTGDNWRLGHRPALDGVRGVAILLVIASHAWPEHLVTAGPVGVAVFFVLSGYLITGTMLTEHAMTGRVSVAAFYARRAARLLPALTVLVATLGILCLALRAPIITVHQALAAMFYVSNLARMSGEPMGVLGHTWSLALEEQFYLIFPLALVPLLRCRRAAVLWGVVALAALSMTWRLLLWDAGVVGSRIYYGTDTTIGIILLGCGIALADIRPRRIPAWAMGLLLAALVGLGMLPEGAAGRTLAPLGGAAVAALLLVTMGGERSPLTLPTLRLVGRRSYALYLWHAPILWIVDAVIHPMPLWLTLALLAGAWGATLLSWRYVEQPVKRVVTRAAATPSRPTSPSPCRS